MPVIARFYGIVIKMYFNDHMPPHFHAIYGECVGMSLIVLKWSKGICQQEQKDLFVNGQV